VLSAELRSCLVPDLLGPNTKLRRSALSRPSSPAMDRLAVSPLAG